MLFLVIIVPALVSIVLLQMLNPSASYRSPRRSVVIASGALPALIFILAFAFDVFAVINHHLFHRTDPFMVGFSLMLFPLVLVAFLSGCVATSIAIWMNRSAG